MNGAGLVVVEATAITTNDRISPNSSGIYLDDHIASYIGLSNAIHGIGGKIGIQLAPTGRKASTLPPLSKIPRDFTRVEDGGWTNIVSLSNLIWDAQDHGQPRDLTQPEIKGIVETFEDRARRANETGYDILELHGARSYLIHSF